MWLKKQQPIKLYQSSDLPYVVLEDGVLLCYDNCYGESKENYEHNLCFVESSSNLNRLNTYFYKLGSFPVVVPFFKILELDDCIIEGRVIKTATDSTGDPVTIALIKSDYIRSSENLDELNDMMDSYDFSIILTNEIIDPQVRLFEDTACLVVHDDWYKTSVFIANKISKASHRKYCWTKRVPEISIDCYGIKEADDVAIFNDTLREIGIQHFNVDWVD